MEALDERTAEQKRDEASFEQIDVAMLYIEQARARAERAVGELQRMGAESHLIAATERAQQELSDVARKYRHGTFFAVPDAQPSL